MGDLSISNLICYEDQALFDADDDDKIEIEHDLGLEDEYIEILVSSESRHCSIFCRGDSIVITDNWFKWARSDSIQWIKEVSNYIGHHIHSFNLCIKFKLFLLILLI